MDFQSFPSRTHETCFQSFGVNVTVCSKMLVLTSGVGAWPSELEQLAQSELLHHSISSISTARLVEAPPLEPCANPQ